MIRRFVNVVVENYKTGVYSLHRLDVYKHLFHQSRAHARAVPFLAEEAQGKNSPPEQPMLGRLKELPSAIATWSSSSVDYFSLLGSRSEEGRILCLNKVGTAVVYDPRSDSNFIMPGLKKFKGPVPVSVSVAPAGAGAKEEEEQLYVIHGGPDGLELNFSVLRYGHNIKGWYWHSLPVPAPFVDDRDPQYKYKVSAYTVVDGGSTICLSSSSVAGGVVGTGTYCFDTVSYVWKRAGDWVLPFTGKAEYIPHLNLWLGFSLLRPGCLCAASDMMLMDDDNKPMSLIVWPDHTPKEKEWMPAVNDAKLLSLGSGRFAVANFFKAARDTVEDEILVLSGVELEFRGKGNNNNHSLQGLKLLQHKSISYTCANGTAIRSVL